MNLRSKRLKGEWFDVSSQRALFAILMGIVANGIDSIIYHVLNNDLINASDKIIEKLGVMFDDSFFLEEDEGKTEVDGIVVVKDSRSASDDPLKEPILRVRHALSEGKPLPVKKTPVVELPIIQLEPLKAWEAMGVSRAQYYRKIKDHRATSQPQL